MRKIFIVLIFLLILLGCVTDEMLSKLKRGISKDEVEKIMKSKGETTYRGPCGAGEGEVVIYGLHHNLLFIDDRLYGWNRGLGWDCNRPPDRTYEFRNR